MRQLLGPFAAALLLTVPACAQVPPSTSTSPDAALIEDLVVANHILYDQGVVDGFGHVSARSNKDPNHFLMARSMAPGLVTASDILEFDLDGNAVDNPQGRAVYLERFIHSEIYKAHPEVKSVVHSHSPSIIPFGATGVPLRPIYHMSSFLGAGVPIFEIREAGGDATDMLVRTSELGAALAKVLGQAPIVLMRGHGFNTVGTSIRQAVSRAIYAEINARILTDALKMGSVVYLNESEAANIAKTNDASIGRSWEIWKVKALANTPKY